MSVALLQTHVLRDTAHQPVTIKVREATGGKVTHAVVLLPAIAGVNDYVADRAGHLAEQGYTVVVIDYFRNGAAPDLSTMDGITAAVDSVDDAQVLADLDVALAWIEGRGIARERVGVLGFCIGGTYAVLAAGQSHGAACAVAYYGQLRYAKRSERKPIDPMALATDLRVPLLGHFGDMDRLIGAEEIAEFRGLLRGGQRHHEIFSYGGAPHAFDEWFRPAAFRPIASAQAWSRTLTFLDWHLRQRSPTWGTQGSSDFITSQGD